MKTRHQSRVASMIAAAYQGNVDKVRTLAKQGASVNDSDRRGFTSIWIASQEGRSDVIRTLVDLGADVNRRVINGYSPVWIAAQEGHVDAVRTLVKLGADIHGDVFGNTLMCIAVQNGNINMLKTLAELGADIHSPCNCGCTPLFKSVWFHQIPMFEALVELGVDVNKPNADGETPLFMAARRGNVQKIRALAKLGADVNCSSNNGFTPLMTATEFDNEMSVRALVELGGNINARNIDGVTAVMIAAEANNVDLLRILALELGADVNIPDNDGNTPLFNASEDGFVDVTYFLLSIGADTPLLLYKDAMKQPPELKHLLDVIPANLPLSLVGSVHVSFAMSKLMTSVMANSLDKCNNGSSDVTQCSQCSRIKEFEGRIVMETFCLSMKNSVISHTKTTCYPLKRQLCRLAYRAYLETLSFDGDRISLSTKARRYVELVCFFLDQAMLTDVHTLRMTCKSNHENRRFPVCYSQYRELEANLIEGWVAYDACRFVSTGQIRQVIAIHNH